MPSYAAGTPIGLYVGDSVTLVNDASTDSGVTNTRAVTIEAPAKLTLTNTTDKTAIVYVAAKDYPGSTGNYEPLTDADTGVAIQALTATTISFTTAGPFVLAHFASAPTSGSLVIAR